MKIFEDTFAVKKPQWCWRSAWTTGYDSAFGLLMKFALLNALTAKEVATLFVSRTRGRRGAILQNLNIDLRDPQVFDLPAIALALRTDIATVSSAFVGSAFADFHASASDLKWCEQCLAWGLHLPLTQMRMVSRCPIHNLVLKTRCTQCEARIPYVLNTSNFEFPFRCPNCQFDLAAQLRLARSRIPAMRTEEVTRISLMHKYLTGCAKLTRRSQPVPTLTGHCARLRLPDEGLQQGPGYLGFIGQVVDEMAASDGQYCLPLTSVAKASCGFGQGSAGLLHERLPPDGIPERFQTTEELVVAKQVYRAVRRRFWRKLGEHRSCVATACQHIWWDMRGARTVNFCAKAAPYIRWRMLWEGCGTPRYLDAKGRSEYFGILGWLQARPAPYPDDWPTASKEWMLAHIFAGVCLASYDALEKEATDEDDGELVWDAQKRAPDAATHWVLANPGLGERPIIFTPAYGLMRTAGPDSVSSAHRTWHARRLSSVVR